MAVQPHHSERSTKLLRYTSLATLLNQSFGFLLFSQALPAAAAATAAASHSAISLVLLSSSAASSQQSSLGLISSGSTISGSSSHSIFGGFPGSQTSSLHRLILVHGNPIDYDYGWDLESFGHIYDVDKTANVHGEFTRSYVNVFFLKMRFSRIEISSPSRSKMPSSRDIARIIRDVDVPI